MRILDPIPIIVLFLLTSGLLILIYEIGFRVGRRFPGSGKGCRYVSGEDEP